MRTTLTTSLLLILLILININTSFAVQSNNEEKELVAMLQQFLVKEGYMDSANVDGVYGSKTNEAVKRYIQDNEEAGYITSLITLCYRTIYHFYPGWSHTLIYNKADNLYNIVEKYQKPKFKFPTIGMSYSEVKDCIGYPDKINNIDTAFGHSEIWIYWWHNKTEIHYYISFDNGTVTLIQY